MNLMCNSHGIDINASKWEAFAISDKHGVDAVKETYNWYLRNTSISWVSDLINRMEPILKLRA